jgi:hypothetical protein
MAVARAGTPTWTRDVNGIWMWHVDGRCAFPAIRLPLITGKRFPPRQPPLASRT